MKSLAHLLMISTVFVATSTLAWAKDPNCAGPEAWPSGMALTYLKNAGVLDEKVMDFQKTKVSIVASEKIGKDLYRQVHLVRFFKHSGEQVVAITVNNASHQECSMSDVDVYLVSNKLGGYTDSNSQSTR